MHSAQFVGDLQMIIVDKALEKRQQDGNPIRVGLVGAGYIGRGIALQIEKFMTGMRLVAISNRTLSRAERAYKVHIKKNEDFS